MEVMVGSGDNAASATVTLRGDLDLATAPIVDERLGELVERGQIHIVVDLGEVTFCDSMGINILVRAKRRCEQHGGSFSVSRVSGEVKQILRIAGLLDILTSSR